MMYAVSSCSCIAIRIVTWRWRFFRVWYNIAWSYCYPPGGLHSNIIIGVIIDIIVVDILIAVGVGLLKVNNNNNNKYLE